MSILGPRGRHPRPTLTTFTALGVVVALGLSGCSGGSDDNGDPKATEGATSSTLGPTAAPPVAPTTVVPSEELSGTQVDLQEVAVAISDRLERDYAERSTYPGTLEEAEQTAADDLGDTTLSDYYASSEGFAFCLEDGSGAWVLYDGYYGGVTFTDTSPDAPEACDASAVVGS